MVLGHGIGELSGKGFRIAHMGHINAPMVFGTLNVIEMAMGAMDTPSESRDVQAAIIGLANKCGTREALAALCARRWRIRQRIRPPDRQANQVHHGRRDVAIGNC
jgi:hypothetical protein